MNMYLKAPNLDVAGVDNTDNAFLKDIIGNKWDNIKGVVSANYTLINYLKGIVQEVAQRGAPKMVHVRLTDTSYADVLNITDKGFLIAVVAQMKSGGAAAKNAFARFTLDGVTICTPSEAILAKTTVDVVPNITIPFFHRFNTSLLIEGYTNDAAHPVDFFVTYTVDL